MKGLLHMRCDRSRSQTECLMRSTAFLVVSSLFKRIGSMLRPCAESPSTFVVP